MVEPESTGGCVSVEEVGEVVEGIEGEEQDVIHDVVYCVCIYTYALGNRYTVLGLHLIK